MQKLIIALVMLGFVAFVYQGIALSSREEAVPDGSVQVSIEPRPPR